MMACLGMMTSRANEMLGGLRGQPAAAAPKTAYSMAAY
jgi:hypothetical protein